MKSTSRFLLIKEKKVSIIWCKFEREKSIKNNAKTLVPVQLNSEKRTLNSSIT